MTYTMGYGQQAFPRATEGTHAIDLRLGGAILFLAGSIILMGIISAEALYPAPYTTGGSEISDLGGTRPPEGLVLQPSATIFDVSMIVIGLMVIAGSIFVHRAFGRRAVTIPILVLGVGALGVGLFPGNTGTPHALFAMATFIAGGRGVHHQLDRHEWTVPVSLDAVRGRRPGDARELYRPGRCRAAGLARRGRSRAMDRVPDRALDHGVRRLHGRSGTGLIRQGLTFVHGAIDVPRLDHPTMDMPVDPCEPVRPCPRRP